MWQQHHEEPTTTTTTAIIVGLGVFTQFILKTAKHKQMNFYKFNLMQ